MLLEDLDRNVRFIKNYWIEIYGSKKLLIEEKREKDRKLRFEKDGSKKEMYPRFVW